jgi:hypothetical protein
MIISRSEFLDFLKLSCAGAVPPTRPPSAALAHPPTALDNGATLVNDLHSQLNRTRVSCVVRPTLLSDLHSTVVSAVSQGTFSESKRAGVMAARRTEPGGALAG